MVGVPNFAPPGCLNVTLGVKVYPLPELIISTSLIDPLVTVAFNVAILDPSFVGACISTRGGFVSLYPLPPSSKRALLIPFTSAVAEAPTPPIELIETFGGYSNWYKLPVILVLMSVSFPSSLTRAYPTAPDPKEGIGASTANTERNLPLRGASLKINWLPSIKKSILGINNLLSYTARTYSSTRGSNAIPALVRVNAVLPSPKEFEILSVSTIVFSTNPLKYWI